MRASSIIRSSRPGAFCKNDVLKNFAKFTGNHLCQSKTAGLRPATLVKKRLWNRCFPVNFANFLRRCFLYRTPLVAAYSASCLSKFDVCYSFMFQFCLVWIFIICASVYVCVSGSTFDVDMTCIIYMNFYIYLVAVFGF